MELIADILLASGALGASFYCYILGRKLNRFNSLEKGVGGAVAVLSAQVDDLEKTIEAAQLTATNSANSLSELTQRAKEISRQLELQMASLHDVAGEAAAGRETETKVLKQAEPMFVRHSEAGVKH
jgi:methyl-accepting chemotaxis protein